MTQAELAGRLERLERDNRRLKRIVLAALALLGATVGLGATYATRAVPQKIVAHEFEVVDGTGRVRMRMAIGPQMKGAALYILDAAGLKREEFSVNDLGDAAISLLNSSGYASVAIMHVHSLAAPDAVQNEFYLSRPGTGAFPPMGILLRVTNAGAPTISLFDPQGYSMDLGSTQTVTPHTGETHQPSAASIVMFGNDKEHRVIWHAP